jgi:hypothetical protein
MDSMRNTYGTLQFWQAITDAAAKSKADGTPFDLCQMQEEQDAAGYREGQLVKSIHGHYSIRYASGLQGWGFIARGIGNNKAEAIRIGKAWVDQSPTKRLFTWFDDE